MTVRRGRGFAEPIPLHPTCPHQSDDRAARRHRRRHLPGAALCDLSTSGRSPPGRLEPEAHPLRSRSFPRHPFAPATRRCRRFPLEMEVGTDDDDPRCGAVDEHYAHEIFGWLAAALFFELKHETPVEIASCVEQFELLLCGGEEPGADSGRTTSAGWRSNVTQTAPRSSRPPACGRAEHFVMSGGGHRRRYRSSPSFDRSPWPRGARRAVYQLPSAVAITTAGLHAAPLALVNGDQGHSPA